jgi:hypothetical protein
LEIVIKKEGETDCKDNDKNKGTVFKAWKCRKKEKNDR